MFQLIVAVISIALVAALAIASIFYGGEAFSKSSEKANVTALVNSAQQISGAYTLYKTDFGGAPPNGTAGITAMVSGKYLASAPTAGKIAGAGAAWTLDTTNGFALIPLRAGVTVTGTGSEICQEVNRQAGHATGATEVANPQFDCEDVAGTVNFRFRL